MRYKKQEIDVNITLTGIPNKSDKPKLLYHYQGTTSLRTLAKMVRNLREWYPLSKAGLAPKTTKRQEESNG